MASEQYGFVFAVCYIIVFSALLSTMPTGLYGAGATPDLPLIPVNPSLLSTFSITATYKKSNFTWGGGSQCFYLLGGYEWECLFYGDQFSLGAKVKIGGVLWLGQLDSAKFISSSGEDRGGYLALTEIDEDATEGIADYDLISIGGGNSLGGFIVYWNTTTYSTASDAWTAGYLYLLHGLGIGETATSNIGALIVSALLFQIPDAPFLINIILVTPLWASILYILWFIIKEMIPFV